MQQIANWIELAKVPDSKTHRLEIIPEEGSGWIKPLNNSNDLGQYLSTHTFYGSMHEYSTKLLQGCGFNVVLANLDA